jgi:SRSO17 transposase
LKARTRRTPSEASTPLGQTRCRIVGCPSREITYQGVQHFITHATWDADRIWRRLLKVLPERHGVLIIDGTSFPKQGTHSVGVARQYCGALGK